MPPDRFIPVSLTLAGLIVLLCLRVASAAIVPGHAEAWGYNFFGQATPPPGLDGIIAVAAGNEHNLVLRTNGTVVAWGANFSGQSTVPPGLNNVIAISANAHSVALRSDGTVVVWGSAQPAVTNVPANVSGVRAIAAGSGANGNVFTLALLTSGTVVAWGTASFTETQVPPGLTNVVGIAAGSYHALAVRADGTVVGWGQNLEGQATPPPGLSDAILVRAGEFSSFALKSDGTIVKWGLPGNDDPPSGLTGVIDFSIGIQHGIALRTDGTVVAWGENSAGQTSVPPLLNGVTAVSAGARHNLVLTPRPVITSITPPASVAVAANVTLSVTASGEPLRYQWQHKGTNLPAATNASLTIRNIDPSRGGSYAVFVSNPHGFNYASTSVSLPAPSITAHPQSRTAFRGEAVTLTVSVSGLAPFTYQWFRNGAAIPNATNATVLVPTLSGEDSSAYRVTVTDSAGGAATSTDAVVTVFDPRETSVTLRPVLDTSIFSDGVNPLGTATILSGTRRNGVRDRGLLRFDFSALPTNAVIENASLRLRLIQAPRGAGPDTPFRLHRVLKPWGAEASWAKASSNLEWATAGGAANVDYTTNGIPMTFVSGSADYSFGTTNEMAADLSAWLQNPAKNYGWFLINDREDLLATARHFGSSESGNPPELFIRYSIPAEDPTIRGITRESTNLVFSIDGMAGWIYNLQTRQEVDRGLWTGFTNAPAGAGMAPIIITVPMTNSHQFFRALRN
jgi:hypothetical protein